MKKQTKIFLGILAVVLLIAGAMYADMTKKHKDNKYVKTAGENCITRFAWLEMLCEKNGISKYRESKPYFSDVTDENACFSYVQSAVEWDILKTENTFDGNMPASGRFIALTAVRAIGSNRLRMVMGEDVNLDDDVCVEFAVRKGLLSQEDLYKGLDKSQCEAVLARLETLCVNDLRQEDYTQVTYNENVIMLTAGDVVQHDEALYTLEVTKETLSRLNVGDVILCDNTYNGLKCARKIKDIDDGILYLSSDVELSEVLNTLEVSDVVQFTAEDIISYYSAINSIDTSKSPEQPYADTAMLQTMSLTQTSRTLPAPAKHKETSVSGKGFALSLHTEEENDKNLLKLDLTNHENGVTVSLALAQVVDTDCDYNVDIDVDKFSIAAQVNYDSILDVQYADVSLDVHTTMKGGISKEISAGKDDKILLCKTPVPLGNGLVGVTVELYLVITAKGSVSFEVEVPTSGTVMYEKDKGVRCIKPDGNTAEPSIKAACEGNALFCLEPTLVLLDCMNVLDAELYTGFAAKGELAVHATQQCLDVSVAYPIITVAVGDDDDKTTVCSLLGVSAEWKIIELENAPYRFGFHHETLMDGTTQFVDACTYHEDLSENDDTPTTEAGNGDEKPEEAAGAVDLNHICWARLSAVDGIEANAFCFKYPDGWEVTYSKVHSEIISNWDWDGSLYEEITLTSKNGIQIEYVHCNTYGFDWGSGCINYQVEKVADSSFTPGDIQDNNTSALGPFVVAKLTVIGTSVWGTSWYDVVEDGSVAYAVIPESWLENLGNFEYSRVFTYGEDNDWKSVEQCMLFDYAGEYAFYVWVPKEGITERETQEIIAILSSFQEDWAGYYEEVWSE